MRRSGSEVCGFAGRNGCQRAESGGMSSGGVPGFGSGQIIRNLNQVYFENRGFLTDYQIMQTELFEELSEEAQQGDPPAKRLDIAARYQGVRIPFGRLLVHLEEEIAQLKDLIQDGDRELFEDILANTVSRKIRGRINGSNAWVDKMNALMEEMNTSSGLKLSLRWRSRTAETEEQLDTRELVELLKKDYRLMREEEAAKLSHIFVPRWRRQTSCQRQRRHDFLLSGDEGDTGLSQMV